MRNRAYREREHEPHKCDLCRLYSYRINTQGGWVPDATRRSGLRWAYLKTCTTCQPAPVVVQSLLNIEGHLIRPAAVLRRAGQRGAA